MKNKILLVLAISTSSAALYAQSGNVGIGTTTPATKLHVLSSGTGGAGVFNTNLANMALRLTNSGNGQSVIQHFLAKDAAGATKEFLLGINPTFNSGNGIFYMGVNGSNIQVMQMDLVTGNVSVGSGPGLSKFNVGSNLSIGTTYISTAAPANGAIIEGNVGIGTTAPAAKLHVAGTVQIADGSQGANKVLTSDANGLASWQTPAAAAPLYYDWLKAGGAQPTAAGDNTGDIYHAGGKVAIGTTAASGRLTVSGNGGSVTPILTLTNTNVAGNPTLNIYPGYTSSVGAIAEGNQYAVVFDQDPGQGTVGAVQSLYDFHGQVRYTNASTLSDRRLKENITDMKQYGLKEVLQMQPRNYVLKEYQTKDIGFIAQELKQIVPELVMGKETENTLLSVDYSKVCLVLINAIKDQQAQIEVLKTSNTGLKASNTELKAEVSKIAQLSNELNALRASVEKLVTKPELASNQ